MAGRCTSADGDSDAGVGDASLDAGRLDGALADGAGGDADPDASMCGHVTDVRDVSILGGFSELDVLIVVDGSPAMRDLDPAVPAGVVATIERLAAGDGTAAGIGAYGAVPVRVGVVDMDVGLPGVAACDGGHGFHTRAVSADAECARTPVSATAEGTLYYERGSTFTPEEFAGDVACAMRVGTDGCPVTRGMDAILDAVDPARGLVRADGFLVIVVLTAQDDCSTVDPTALASAIASGARADVACLEMSDHLASIHDTAQQLVTRVHDGTLGWTLNVVAGTPSDFFPGATLVPLVPHVDPSSGGIAPACTSATGFRATPAQRWAALGAAVADLGEGSPSVRSVCGPLSESFLGDVERADIGLTGECLSEPAQTDAAGLAACEVEVTLPPFGTSDQPEHCADVFAADAFTEVRTEWATLGDRSGLAEVCHLRQLTRDEATTRAGWVYDDGTLPGFPPAPCTPFIRLHGITVRLGRTTFRCTKASTTCADSSRCPSGLECDAFTRTCQHPCATSSDCGAGEECDQRTALAYFGEVPSGLDPTRTRSVCFVPACDPASRR